MLHPRKITPGIHGDASVGRGDRAAGVQAGRQVVDAVAGIDDSIKRAARLHHFNQAVGIEIRRRSRHGDHAGDIPARLDRADIAVADGDAAGDRLVGLHVGESAAGTQDIADLANGYSLFK